MSSLLTRICLSTGGLGAETVANLAHHPDNQQLPPALLHGSMQLPPALLHGSMQLPPALLHGSMQLPPALLHGSMQLPANNAPSAAPQTVKGQRSQLSDRGTAASGREGALSCLDYPHPLSDSCANFALSNRTQV